MEDWMYLTLVGGSSFALGAWLGFAAHDIRAWKSKRPKKLENGWTVRPESAVSEEPSSRRLGSSKATIRRGRIHRRK